MGTIRQLPVHLVNKIAAGECIERPASIVKELLENAIDAGATRIDIYLEQGGSKLIRVVDNGVGILPEDLPLAVKPHATSKIADENDLYAIDTLGFRGEALASIASVSILKISSVAKGHNEGASIEVRGGLDQSIIPYAGATGTVVEVQNLFYNTPARRKFLKTANTEMNHCQDVVIKIALPRENIAFTLYHNNRRIIEVPPVESKRQRIEDLFGAEIAGTLVQVFTQKQGITFSAYICKPEFARASNRWQYFFVNGRAIRDRFIAHAFKEAYRGLIPNDRYPIGFLFLDVDPAIVDVNVHPTKSEVRFADSGYIHSIILGAIRQRFLSADLTSSLNISHRSTENASDRNSKNLSSIDSEMLSSENSESSKNSSAESVTQHSQDSSFTGQSDSPDIQAKKDAIRNAFKEFFISANASENRQMKIDFRSPKNIISPDSSAAKRAASECNESSYPNIINSADISSTKHISSTQHISSDINSHQAESAQEQTQTNSLDNAITQDSISSESSASELHNKAPLNEKPKALQIHNSYLVVETENGLMIIDQHALHERILYQQLKSKINAGTIAKQKLLIPEVVELTPEQMAQLERINQHLDKAGMEIEPFGPRSIAVHSVPAMSRSLNIPEFIEELLDRIKDSEQLDSETILEHILQSVACKAAVKAGQQLKAEEIETLLALRDITDMNSACPHGRPTALQMSLSELEKQFKRT